MKPVLVDVARVGCLNEGLKVISVDTAGNNDDKNVRGGCPPTRFFRNHAERRGNRPMGRALGVEQLSKLRGLSGLSSSA